MALINCERQIRQMEGFTPVALMCDPFNLLSGGGGGTTEQVVWNAYRATSGGTGIFAGDVLWRYMKIDLATMAQVGSEVWYNVDTNAFIAAPVLSNVRALDDYRRTLTAVTLTVSTVAVGLPSIHASANYAELQVHDADIVFTYDGATTPQASPVVGFSQQANALIRLQSRDELLNFSAIRAGGTDARVFIQYQQVRGGGINQ